MTKTKSKTVYFSDIVGVGGDIGKLFGLWLTGLWQSTIGQPLIYFMDMYLLPVLLIYCFIV